MRIAYVGAGRFPTEKASGYQIAQMLLKLFRIEPSIYLAGAGASDYRFLELTA